MQKTKHKNACRKEQLVWGTHTHTHTHTATRRLCLPIILAMCLAVFGATSSHATVVPPASSFPEVPVATQSLYDPTINCDMIFEPNGFIKAIAWSDNGTAQSYIYAEDYYGNTSTINLPIGAINPDIAFANYEDLLTSTLVYEVAVTFTIGKKLYVEVYELQNVGTSSFALNTTPLYTVNISDDCTGLPHIDMWPDHTYHYIIGYASCHQFAVSFSEGSSGAHWGYLKAYVNDVDNWNITAPVFPLLSTSGTPIENVLTPDVACQYNIDLASTVTQRLNITFSSVSPPPIPMPTPAPSINYLSGTNSVSTLEYNYSSGTTTLGPTIVRLGNILFPRIESPGQFDEAFASTTPKWQIAYNIKGGSPGVSTDQVEGYNNLAMIPSGISSTDFPPPNQCMSACVAAGAEANGILTSPIGNNQYTVGFYPWGNLGGPRTLSIFARNIDMLGGGGLMSTNTYEVNNNPVDFYWDFNRNMAISNCSNYGNDILSAWYNGKDIVYKHSTPDVMSFRAAPNNITAPEQVGTLIAPNPANSFLKISGIPSGTKYLITDISGRTVLQGQLSAEQKIDTQSLTDGKYFIRILGGGKFMKIIHLQKNKFMIQNNTELMKRLRYLIAFTIAIIFSQANQLHAQTPQYQYTINPLPQEVLCDPAFGWRIMAKKQTIYTRYKFPTMPAGQLKAIYFRVGQDYQLIHDPGAACTVTDFSAAIGYTNDTVFRRIGNGPDSFKTGLTKIYGPDTFSFPCSGKKGDWIRIPVTKNGFYYNPEGAKFVVEYKIKKQNNENMWLPCIEGSTFDLGARTTIRILSDIDSLTGSASLGYMDLGIDLVSAGVNDVGSNLSSFGLFPNPATEGRFSISMETKQAVRQLSISIRNAIGQTLYTSSYQNTGTRFFKEFDQSKLPSGVYFLELNVDAEKIVRQLVLQ